MLSKIKQSWKVKDVRRRILYTLMMILIFRIGTTIPVPGVDTSIISKLVSGNSLLALYNMFTGGAFSNFTLFALGIGPYITASIIIQLLTVGFESLKELQKSGEEGRKKMNMYTRYTALVLAIIQAVGITLGVVKGALKSDNIFFITTVIITLIAASMILMWMGDRITEKGLGNGSSIIIFVGIISRIPTDIISVEENIIDVSKALGKKTTQMTIMVQDRERHNYIFEVARKLGCKIRMFDAGDVAAGIATCFEETGVDMLMGIGGGPEGVITAAAIKCMGGDMQAQIYPLSDEERERCHQMGYLDSDIEKKLTIDDLAKGDDLFFAATGITEGNLLKGVVNIGGNKARTESVVMRGRTGTIRFVNAIHNLDKNEILIDLMKKYNME